MGDHGHGHYEDHDDVVRRSFGRQTGLFTGSHSPFAAGAAGPPAWVGPLEPDMVCRPGGPVVVSDMVAPAADAREGFDALQRGLDPSHARVLLEDVLAELLQLTVGPVTYRGAPEPLTIPLDAITSHAADRDGV